MGLFDFLKKGRTKSVESDISKYNPWDNRAMPRNDNYAIAAFISMCENGAKLGNTNDDYPRYFSYDYGVNDPAKYHKQVIVDGFLTEAEPGLPLKHMKVAELKEILEKNNLQNKGKKEELIKRITDNVDVSELGLETYYVPTEKGEEHLRKYEYVFSLRKYGITWEQYDNFKSRLPCNVKPNDIIWRMLNDKFNLHNVDGDFGLARNELYNMGNFLKAENKCLDALYHFIIVLYYDTSGCGNKYVSSAESIFIAPCVAEEICKLKAYYEPMLIDKCYQNYGLPNHHISKKNFRRLVEDVLEDKPLDVQKYL